MFYVLAFKFHAYGTNSKVITLFDVTVFALAGMFCAIAVIDVIFINYENKEISNY